MQKQDGNKKSRINFDMETDEDESGEIFSAKMIINTWNFAIWIFA